MSKTSFDISPATNSGSSPSHIAVRGKGSTTRKPDVAYIQVFTRSSGVLLADAVAEATSKAEQVVSSLRATYSSIQQIRVTDALVGESQDYSPARMDKSQPEVVKAVLVIAPPDPVLAVAIVDSASRLGCTFQNSGSRMSRMYPQNAIQYALADCAAAELEATRLAFDDARAHAASLCETASLKLGAIWFASLASQTPAFYERETEIAWPGESLSDHKSLSADAVTIEQTVELRYLIA